jgi:pimeloyl-ACP methyl ester carboxylesterase
MLIALPPSSPPGISSTMQRNPLFFAHGGCGSASVWLPYMEFFSQRHQIPCYALSYRGHGDSWYPGFFRMYFTWMSTFASDLAAGMEWVRQETGEEVCLVGHSSGGGLGQYILSQGMGGVRVKGLCLAGAIPGFGRYVSFLLSIILSINCSSPLSFILLGGFFSNPQVLVKDKLTAPNSLGVNLNWLSLDPYFLPRMFFKHLGHPMSPLSSTALVKQAFFSPEYPLSKVVKFEENMPKYESFLWPNGMLFPFVSFKNILQRITGWGRGERILILAGEKDRLVSLDIAQREASEYRDAFKELVVSKKIEAKVEEVAEEGIESAGWGVRFRVVEGAGHHFQNDNMWEVGAEKLLEFYEQL